MAPGAVIALRPGVQPLAYFTALALGALACAGLCIAARLRPGRWRFVAARGIALVLVGDAASYTVALVVQGDWSPATSLPLALCNMAVLVAAAACWWRTPVLVELTYFWGTAGTLQALVTPDLDVGFPRRVFFEYMIGHTAIVTAALFLVVGLRLTPRRGAIARTFAITAAYTAFVGLVDWLSGANYMFLREPPENWTILRLLGPWPWYVVSAAGVGLVLIALLDAPFRAERRHRAPPVPHPAAHRR